MKKLNNFNHSKPVLQMGKILFVWVMGLQLLLFAGCKHDDLSVPLPNENLRPASDFLKNNYEMHLFYAALKKVGYVDELNGAGPFTILAPSDESFNALGIFNPSDFDKMNVDSLKKVIGYHILPRRLRVSDIPNNGVDVRYATLEGTELYTTLASNYPNNPNAVNDLYFSGVKVNRKDVVLANGVLHTLYGVMKPNFKKTTQQWLADHPDYSVFVKGLKKFNLWDQLNTNTQFTIFAPDNKALENVDITEASLNAMDASKYLGDLLFGAYLLYDKHFFISDSEAFAIINANGGYSYFLHNNSYYMNFGSARVSISKVNYGLTLRTGSTFSDVIVKSVTNDLPAKNDNICSNGVIHHLVDGLVTPNQAIKK
ncbi:fasciclin domain-containing protein [Pedobacter nototheniae]|uniref:fasciclin domain-containing protein n=1 Tax=Pedobacter nototheniae TaxID=2488994 RepID=UPI0029317911|nr:fasciclin domain-containing protein [Pedobacter nototheniae]